MNKQQLVYQEKLVVAKLPNFKSRCAVCKTKITPRKGFTFHHLWYLNGERNYSDFDNDTLAYHTYLIPLIKENPNRFKLVCRNHHVILERMLRWNDASLRRLIRLVNLTRKT